MVEVSIASEQDTWPRTRELTGRLESTRSSHIGFEVSGTVLHLVVDEGANVQAGAVLGRVDTQRPDAAEAEIGARLAQAQAQLDELLAGTRESVVAQAAARLQLMEARRDQAAVVHQRMSSLSRGRAISPQEADDARFNLSAAEAEVALARWQLKELERGPRPETIAAQQAVVQALERQQQQLRVDVAKASLRAPFSGVIARRHVDEGRVVAPGEAVFTLLDNSQYRLRLGVPPDLVPSMLAKREAITVSSGNADQLLDFTAKLAYFLPDRDPTTRTRVALLTIDDLPEALAAGDLATALVRDDLHTRGIQVPLSALREAERGLWSCLVVSENNRVEARQVLILHEDSTHAIVRGSLLAGDQVIVSGLNRVVPGMQVRITNSEHQP